MNWKNSWTNIVLVIASTLLSLFVAEVIVRVFVSVPAVIPDSERIIYDPALGYRLIPDKPDLNQDKNGFQNTLVPPNPDFVALGDSHTQGLQAWPTHLGKMLGMQWYNMGLSGYGTAQYRYLADEALKMKPKFLIIGFYLGNDAWNAYYMVYNYDYWKNYRSPDFTVDTSVTSTSSGTNKVKIRFRTLRDFLHKYSRLYLLAGRSTILLREKFGLSKPRVTGTDDWSNNDPDVSLRYEDDPRVASMFWPRPHLQQIDLSDRNVQEGWRLTEIFIREISEKARRENVKVVMPLFPTKEIVYAGLVDSNRVQSNQYMKEIVANEIALKDQITELCIQQRILCVDILPHFMNLMKQGLMLYPSGPDNHPLVPFGQKEYAQAISDFIRENKLTP